MVCKKYSELSPHEKNIFAGELFHSVVSNDLLFETAELIIKRAKEIGLFNNVKILPENEQGDNSNKITDQG